MLPFDVIFFDVGGVLLTNSWDVRERVETAQRFRLDVAELQARHAGVFDPFERGAISLDAYLDAVVFDVPRGFTRDEFVAAMRAQSKLLPNGALPVLEELAGTGRYLVGALSNDSRELNQHRFETFGLRRYFDVVLSSCFVGLRKPEPAIYRLAVDVVGGPAERILFIDDRPENVAGAQAAGMRSFRFAGETALREELARMQA